MRFNAPRIITWLISLGLVVFGIVVHVAAIKALAKFDFWLVVAGAAVLLLGTLLKNL